MIGIEISAELNEVARTNIDRQGAKLRCRDIELVEADAARWEVPDDLTVAYFYYPFVGATFEGVIDNLVASHERNPRRMRLAYGLPTMEDYILVTGRFDLVRTVRIVSLGIPHRLSPYETGQLPLGRIVESEQMYVRQLEPVAYSGGASRRSLGWRQSGMGTNRRPALSFQSIAA